MFTRSVVYGHAVSSDLHSPYYWKYYDPFTPKNKLQNYNEHHQAKNTHQTVTRSNTGTANFNNGSVSVTLSGNNGNTIKITSSGPESQPTVSLSGHGLKINGYGSGQPSIQLSNPGKNNGLSRNEKTTIAAIATFIAIASFF